MRNVDLRGMRYKQAWSEVSEQRPLRGRVGSRGLEQQRYGDFEAFEGVFLARRRGTDLLGRAAQRILEQGEQELVLTVELQVEASQRLARPVDDLLDREVGAALLDDDRLCRVKETLNALSGPELRCLDRSLNRALLPGGLFARTGHRRLRCWPSGENMH